MAAVTTPSPAPLSAELDVNSLRPNDLPAADVREAEKARDVLVRRARPQLVGRALLHEPPGAHDRHAVAERERFRLVVGDVESGHRECVEQLPEVVEQAVAEAPVERAERLVQQKDARRRCERAGERDPLLLTARQRRDRPALEARETDEFEHLAHAGLDGIGRIAPHPQPERDVPEDVAMLKERVILEHQSDPAPVRRHCSEIFPGEQDATRIRLLQPGDHAQQRALPGAARTEDRDHFALGDLERDARQCVRVVEAHGHVLDPQHQNHPARCSRPRSTRKTETATTTISTTASA